MSETVTHLAAGPAWSRCASLHLVDHVVRGCSRNAEQPLLKFEDGLIVGRAEFRALCERFAGYLKAHVKPGERVAIALSNRTEFFIALVAVVACRGVLVSINPEARKHDAGYVLADSQPVVLIVQSSNQRLFRELAQSQPSITEIIEINDDEPHGLPPHTGSPEPFDLGKVECQRDDITAVFYTSGTTGAPKGCMVSHGWWLRIVDVDLRMNPDGRMRSMSSTPFYYADPSIYLMMMFEVGGTLVPMRRFTVSRYWDIVHAFDITKIHAIASIPVLLVKAPPHPLERSHKVHHATCAAVPTNLHRALVDRFGFPWIDNYGATETGMICRMPWQCRDEMVGSGSLGVADPEVELRVVDDTGRDVPAGEAGECIIRAPDMFKGYYNQPKATSEALREGWYFTGDLVRRDARGFVYFLGRKKDIVRRGGQNVAASEVEAVLRLLPQVKDAAVIPVPDDIHGEEIKAYVLLVDGLAPGDLAPETVIAHCAEHLSAFKVPRYLEFRTGDFPRTPSMRVQKQDLKAEKPDLTEGAWDREKTMAPRR